MFINSISEISSSYLWIQKLLFLKRWSLKVSLLSLSYFSLFKFLCLRCRSLTLTNLFFCRHSLSRQNITTCTGWMYQFDSIKDSIDQLHHLHECVSVCDCAVHECNQVYKKRRELMKVIFDAFNLQGRKHFFLFIWINCTTQPKVQSPSIYQATWSEQVILA